MHWYTCTYTSENLAASILRAVKKELEKEGSWKLLWGVGTYVQIYNVKYQKTVMFKNNLLFYKTLLFNYAMHLGVANVWRCDRINIPWSLPAAGMWRTERCHTSQWSEAVCSPVMNQCLLRKKKSTIRNEDFYGLKTDVKFENKTEYN